MIKKIIFYKQSFFLLILIFSISIAKIIPQTNQSLIDEKNKVLIAAKYIQSINSGDKARIKEFITEYYDSTFIKAMPIENHITFQMSNYYISGGLGYEITINTSENKINLTNKLTGADLELIFQFSKKYSNKIINFPEFKLISNSRNYNDEELFEVLERSLDLIIESEEFSGSIMIAKHGTPFFSKSFGYANKSDNIPNKIDTKFNIASIGKMFTGVAIAQLVEKGQLSFEDYLSKYVGNDWLSEDISSKIKIKHLLTHTSGLGDYFRKLYNQCDKFIFRDLNDYKILLIGEKLNYEPGTKWSYSNTGMLLLGVVIEKITGLKYFEYLQKYIFEPAEMINTCGFEKDRPVANRAMGYLKEFTDNKVEWMDNSISRVAKGSPSGGCYSTTEDLLNFDRAIRSNKLLSSEYTQLVLSPKPEHNSSFYGYGFFVNQHGETRIARHSGDGTGINCHFNMYLDSGYTVIVLSNYGRPSGDIVNNLINQLLISTRNQ